MKELNNTSLISAKTAKTETVSKAKAINKKLDIVDDEDKEKEIDFEATKEKIDEEKKLEKVKNSQANRNRNARRGFRR